MKHRLKLKRVFSLVLTLIMIICTFSGCSKSSKLKKNGEIYLYYTNKDRTKLISKTYKPEGDDTIAQVEEVLNQMNTPVKKKNCITAKPESVEISGYTLYDKTVNIDFSSSYYEMSKVTELLCRSAIVLSITQIKGVDSTVRENNVYLEANSKLYVIEKLMTHGNQEATSNMMVEMNGEGSSAQIISRSVAKGSSRQIFHPRAVGKNLCHAHVQCDSIIMDHAEVSSIPEINAKHVDAAIIHEAAIGRINDEQLVKLRTLGMTEEEAEGVIIENFLN